MLSIKLRVQLLSSWSRLQPLKKALKASRRSFGVLAFGKASHLRGFFAIFTLLVVLTASKRCWNWLLQADACNGALYHVFITLSIDGWNVGNKAYECSCQGSLLCYTSVAVHSAFFVLKWPHRLSVRTPGFHPGKRGSTPLGATK